MSVVFFSDAGFVAGGLARFARREDKSGDVVKDVYPLSPLRSLTSGVKQSSPSQTHVALFTTQSRVRR